MSSRDTRQLHLIAGLQPESNFHEPPPQYNLPAMAKIRHLSHRKALRRSGARRRGVVPMAYTSQ
jgi:hypothetical protein